MVATGDGLTDIMGSRAWVNSERLWCYIIYSALKCQVLEYIMRHAYFPTMKPKDHEFCPVYASIELLQEKWNLHIIRALLEGPMGFNDLGRAVGANPTTLAQRLD